MLAAPLICILTDYGVHRAWIAPRVDAYVVASEDMVPELQSFGVEESKIYPFGIPVHGVFFHREDRDMLLRDLRLDYDIRVGGENQVLDVVRRQGSITRNEVMALLRVSKNTAYNRLRQMVARGKLTKVGNRYYLPSTVVPPEDQEQAILAYLSEAGFAYRQDIARVLRIGPRQCWPILQRMLAEHQIAKDGQKYILLQKEA